MSKISNPLPKNAMESLVWQMLDEVLSDFPAACTCEQCKVDIIAVALNHLSPKYVTTYTGEVYNKANMLEHQYKTDLYGTIAKGVLKVHENPRCENRKKTE